MAKLIKGENDLETYCKQNGKEDLLKEWHPTKNGNLKPCDVAAGSNQKVWWILPYDDVKTGKHFDFEWEATISGRTRGKGCPYISKAHEKVWKGYNDLETLYPYLAQEWHPTKNGSLKPSDVTIGSTNKVWWYLPYSDIKTGKHFDFEWEAIICDRVKGKGCPYISGRKVWIGYNDLETLYPNIAKEWHPTKNGNLKPSDVTIGSEEKVWWYLSYDDIKTGKHYDFEWKATIGNRVKGTGFPYCSGSKTERLLYTYCKKNDIAFKAEKKFNDIPIKFYPYDLYLYKSNLVIEADGKQHFESIDYFDLNLKFEERVKRDNAKNEYCLKRKTPILRIPYIYDVINEKDKIEGIVSEFIRTRKVPQEILDFYEPFKESIGSNYFDVASELNRLS